MLENLSPDVGQLLDKRNAFFKKWIKRAGELSSKEKDLHDSLDPEVAKVLKGKRLLVFEEILNEIGFPDKNLVRDICAGFRITGWLRDSMLFLTGQNLLSTQLTHLCVFPRASVGAFSNL